MFMHITRGRASVVLWRRCDLSRTSGFVDDVTFAHNGSMGQATQVRRISTSLFTRWQHGRDTAAYSQIVSPRGSTRPGRTRPGAESDVYDCLVVVVDVASADDDVSNERKIQNTSR